MEDPFVTLVGSALYFLLPAYVANMFPVFADALHLPLEKPIHERLFGSHKTWRGILAALLGAYLTLLCQRYLESIGVFEMLRILPYTEIHLPLFAFLFGFGAMAGDLLKSALKRRIEKPPGDAWFPFDELDTLMALLFVFPFFPLDPARILILVIATPLLHVLTNFIGYAIGVKNVWW